MAREQVTASSVVVGPRAGAPLPQVSLVTGADLSGAAGSAVLAVPVASAPSGESGSTAGESTAEADPGPEGDGVQPRSGAAEAAVTYGVDLALVCEQARFSAAAGATLAVVGASPPPGGPARLVLVGVGSATPRDLRRAGAALARAVKGHSRVATSAVAGLDREAVLAFVEGFLLASWTPPRTALTPPPRAPAAELVLLGCALAAVPDRAAAFARATWRARDLAATPASVKTPDWVAGQARALAAGVAGVRVEVLAPAQLAAQGWGGLLAVGGGSASPPCLVRVTWTPPAAASGRHVVLVGKGITYDTGGLAIKPRLSMVGMQGDMSGAAVVLAVLLGVAELGLPHRVTALLPLAENAFGASSYRPGDVVTIHGGTTVEVADPDAEGRLVLADALHAADAELDPDVLIDVATLTGAAPVALGTRHAALFTADDDLAIELDAAALASGERVWRMPLVEEYRPFLDSAVADLRNIPSPSPGAGAVTAALFLREFVGTRRWAHLDIAGTARSGSDEHEVVKGATGHGARLLLRWMEATS